MDSLALNFPKPATVRAFSFRQRARERRKAGRMVTHAKGIRWRV